MIKRIQYRIFKFINDCGYKLERRIPRPLYPNELKRFSYQKIYNNFNLKDCTAILDIGFGTDPFPYATHIIDLSLNALTAMKSNKLATGKHALIADIHHLPFTDKFFDYVYCSHVLEHTEDPIMACREIIRVGKRGYIEIPTLAKDGLFCWARGQHRWHVVSIADRLCFFEYRERLLDGIRSRAWFDLIQLKEYHPVQEAYYNNLDFFNIMFPWQDTFKIHVFRLDGTIHSSNAF